MPDSLELRIVIRKQGSEYVAVTEQRNGQFICDNTFQHDPAQIIFSTPADLHPESEPSSWIVRRISRRKPRTPQAMLAVQFGAQLYQYAFGNGRRLRDFLRAHKDHQVISLSFVFTPDTAVLSRLPWEYMYDGKVFLCQSRQFQITRQPEQIKPSKPEPSPAPIRMLAMIANPADQLVFDIEDGITCLHQAFASVIADGKVELDVLSEVTQSALYRALRSKYYHVIYFCGYGKYNLMQQRSALCFEDDSGNAEFLGADQLKKLVTRRDPHLLILHGCTNSPTGGHDPNHHFALECLQNGIPAVLNLPPTLRADSLGVLIGELFSDLYAGQTLGESMLRARSALVDLDAALDGGKRLDWGQFACFTGDLEDRFVLAEISSQELDGAERVEIADRSPPIFIDRKNELQTLRKALKEDVSVISLWGYIGAGKSALIDQLILNSGVQFKGILRIQCELLREPLSVLGKIANFWCGRAQIEHQQAADLLLDARQDPFVRAQAAQKHLGQYRYLLIFENIDVWFEESSPINAIEGTGHITYPLISSILLGLLHTQSRTTFVFTGSRRWADLSTLPSANRRDIPLPLLQPIWAFQLMSSLSGLRAVSRKEQEAVYWQLGGHPLAIKLLSAWRLSNKNNHLESLLQNPPVADRSTIDWIKYLLNAIIQSLDPGEAQVLPLVAVLNRPFSAKVLPNLSLISSPYAGTLLNTWRRLELIQDTDVEGQYRFHPLVRAFILDRISAAELKQLHLQAAEYYGAPFRDEARRQIYSRNVSFQSEERVTWLARDINGILGTWLRQEQNTERSQELLDLAMSWHYHLYFAGEYHAAVQIARAVVPVLHRIGLRDLSGELLQRAISAAEGYDRTVGMDDLAKIQIADGHLARALNVYDEVYKALISHGSDLQRAHVLVRSAHVQQQLGLWEDAIKRYEQALTIMRQQRELRGQVVCLYQLSIIFREQRNLQQALVYSQAAKELYDKLIDDRGLASATHEQGHILKEMDHLDGALENFAESMRLCRKMGDFSCVAGNLQEIGDVLHKLGKTEMAIRTLEEAEGLYEMLAAPERVDVMRMLEELYEKQQRLTDAVQRFKAAKHNTAKK